MEQISYSLEKAAKLLNTDIEYLIDLATAGGLRLGVNARGWWGTWVPKDDNGELSSHSGVCDIDNNGIRTYAHDMPDGSTVKLRESWIAQFWYIHHSDLYPLLTGQNKESSEISFFEATNPQALAEKFPTVFTESGHFWVYGNDERNPSTSFRLKDLRIYDSDLSKLKKQASPTSNNQAINQRRIESLKRFINRLGVSVSNDGFDFDPFDMSCSKEDLLSELQGWEKNEAINRGDRVWSIEKFSSKFWSSAERKDMCDCLGAGQTPDRKYFSNFRL